MHPQQLSFLAPEKPPPLPGPPVGTPSGRPPLTLADWPPPIGARVLVVHGIPWAETPYQELLPERKYLIGKIGTVVEHTRAHGWGDDGIQCRLPTWPCPIVEFTIGERQGRTRFYRFRYVWPSDLEVVD